MTSDDKQAGPTEQDAGGVMPGAQPPVVPADATPADATPADAVPADVMPVGAVPQALSRADAVSADDASADGASAGDTPNASVPAQGAPAVAEPGPLPGELLAARRRQLTFSIEEVSQRVRLAPRQITALEANDFAALPGMATVRGFIRSYAKLLGLDPEPLVAMLAHEPNPAFEPMVVRRPLPASGFSTRRYSPPMMHRRGARRLASLAAVILMFVGTLAFIAYRNDWVQLPSLPAAEGPAADVTAPAVLPAQPAAGEAEQGVAAQAGGVLELKAREDSWVEVIAVNGERKLLSKLMKAGSTELVEVGEPVVLLVGNAAGVDASLRGDALNLKAAARDNVVKLSLH